jgi:hypothetical protein
MARADLLIDIVRAGAECNQELFRRALEALITEERSKQHPVLADRLAAHLQLNGHSKTTAPITPVRLNGAACFPICCAHNLEPRQRLLLIVSPGNDNSSLAAAALRLQQPVQEGG